MAKTEDNTTKDAESVVRTYTLEELTTNAENPFEAESWIGPKYKGGAPKYELVPAEVVAAQNEATRADMQTWAERVATWWGPKILDEEVDKKALTEELLTEFDAMSPKEFSENKERVMLFFHLAMVDRDGQQRIIKQYEETLSALALEALLGRLMNGDGIAAEGIPTASARDEVNGGHGEVNG